MNPEIVQLAAEHGTRSASLFWGWEVALEMFLGGTAGSLMFFRGLKRFAPEMDRILHRVVLGCLLLAGALLFLDLGAKQHVYRFFNKLATRIRHFLGHVGFRPFTDRDRFAVASAWRGAGGRADALSGPAAGVHGSPIYMARAMGSAGVSATLSGFRGRGPDAR
jgi:hypothetical protein